MKYLITNKNKLVSQRYNTNTKEGSDDQNEHTVKKYIYFTLFESQIKLVNFSTRPASLEQKGQQLSRMTEVLSKNSISPCIF